MSISQKKIMKILNEEKSLSFSSLYRKLKSSSPALKKRQVRKVLSKLKKKSKVNYQTGGNIIELLKSKTKSRRTDRINPSRDFDIIVRRYDLRWEFPKNVTNSAWQVASKKITKTDNRTDFTQQQLITIDGEDSKDFDDAVYLEKTENGYKLYVHIADVSYYVKEESPIDTEAYERGNSYYLVDKVIPMLPKTLSNGICSLNPKKKRYAVSVKMVFDKDANLVDKEFYESIIISKRRCTYKEVDHAINSAREDLPEDLQEIHGMLLNMKEFAMKLKDKRFDNGSLGLETKELYIKTDKNSAPVDISIKERLISHSIIEEFMLITNVTVSKFLSTQGPTIYRVHEEPDEEKAKDLKKILARYGIQINIKGKITPKKVQTILEDLEKDQFQKNPQMKHVIHMNVLRMMKQAVYSTENLGHFGLAFDNYTHFTSPIRRYPDLVIHRLLKHYIGGKIKVRRCLNPIYLGDVAQKTSKMERVAVEAERDIIKRKSAHFMKDKVGNEYEGIIAGVTNFGLFVELKPYGVEGLCSVKDLKFRYDFDIENNILYSKKNNIKFELGMPVKVKVVNVNLVKSFIDLEIINEKEYAG